VNSRRISLSNPMLFPVRNRLLRGAFSTLLLTSLAGAALTSASLTACSKKETKSKAAKDRPKPSIGQYAKSTPPKAAQPLEIAFDGKAELIGYKIKPEDGFKRGQNVKMQFFWKSVAPIPEGYALVGHVLDESGESVMNLENHGPLRKTKGGKPVLPPSMWEPGKYYTDDVSFKIPNRVKTETVRVVVGIAKKKGGGALAVTKGEKDSQQRALVATLDLTKGGAKSKVPQVRLDKLDAGVKINVDGKLDEAAWQAATPIGPFVDPTTGGDAKASPVQGKARMLWNSEGLFLGVEVTDKDVIGGFKKTDKDPHLWTKDTIELMVDPDGNGDNKDYYEIQINPQNLVFDSRFDDYNQPKKEPDGPFGHQDWSSNVKSKVVVDGTIDKSDDEDKGYTVEAMIPWKSFDKAAKTPPALGDTWRMNVYAMQNNSGVSWSPLLKAGNFHKASRFGRVQFAEKGWTPLAAPATSASGAPSAKPSLDAKAALSGRVLPPGAPVSTPSPALAPKPATPAAPAPAASPK
jgi:hypothetical protein